MKQLISSIIEKLLSMADRTTKARGDMYLPNRRLALAVFLLAVGE